MSTCWSYYLRFRSNHLFLVLSELLFELLFSQLYQCVLECVLGHDGTIKLVALVLRLHLLETVNLSLESVHLLVDFTLFEPILLLKKLVYLFYIILLCWLQYLEGGVLLGLFGFPGGLSWRVVVVHVVNLLVHLDLGLGLQGIKQFLLLGVLFQFFDVPIETATHVKAESQTNDTGPVDHDEVQSLIETSHFK